MSTIMASHPCMMRSIARLMARTCSTGGSAGSSVNATTAWSTGPPPRSSTTCALVRIQPSLVSNVPLPAESSVEAGGSIEPEAAPDDSDDIDIPVDQEEPEDDSLPAFDLLHTRSEEPSERSPLSYREHVYAVAQTTSDADIERLLRALKEM